MRHKKALLLGVGFLIAVFIGFALAGYHQDQADLQNNERQHQEQQMQERAQKLDAQESDLQKQRQALEAKKKALEEKQRSLEREQGRIEGRGQALQDSADGESGVQKFLDKVTGQAEKKQRPQRRTGGRVLMPPHQLPVCSNPSTMPSRCSTTSSRSSTMCSP